MGRVSTVCQEMCKKIIEMLKSNISTRKRKEKKGKEKKRKEKKKDWIGLSYFSHYRA